MPEIVTKYLSNINLNFENLAGVQWQVPAIIILVFLLILTLAQVRRHFVDWSFKGIGMGIVLGFMLAIILEGFLIIGGKTVLIQTLGLTNLPKPFSVALDSGKNELVKVLGASDNQAIKSLICTP